jgi:serine/threonine-protein kinase
MPDLANDTVVDGRYTIKRRLGSGGMADVYCAEDSQLGRNVALKVLHQRFAADQEFVERFRREARSAAGLQHPNVVGVYDRGEWDGTAYIAMEYLDGRTLKEVIQAEAPIDPMRAIDITQQILRAARFAHRRGVVHRDLKPHNVMVDDEGRAKVTDFGIARAGASDMTETGSIMGTAQYLSPEQAQGRPVSPQSDLYSVGVILFEMLTGRVPFQADAAVSVALKHVAEEPPTVAELNPSVPPELSQIVSWAMQKDPARRPADADAFLNALEDVRQHLLRGEGGATAAFVPLAEEPVVEEVVEPDRRRRNAWWIALLLLALAGAALAVFLLTRPDKATVPSVVGQSLTVAQTRLQNDGFKVDVIRRTSDRPKDDVIGQTPNPGVEVDKGETVTLTVSDGPGSASIPDVAGQPEKQAISAVKKAGFKAKVTRQSSDTVRSGVAIGTSPPGGTEIDKGKTVTIQVSTGPAPVSVPDVVGEDRGAARSDLTNAGFQVTETEQESAQTAGTVLSQSPSGGSKVARGSTVRIVVAKEQQITVPDVTGKSSEDAVNKLSDAGFSVQVSRKDVAKPSEDDKVISQKPGKGSKQPKGTKVTIVVGRFNPDVNPNEQTPTTPPTATTPNPTTGGTG